MREFRSDIRRHMRYPGGPSAGLLGLGISEGYLIWGIERLTSPRPWKSPKAASEHHIFSQKLSFTHRFGERPKPEFTPPPEDSPPCRPRRSRWPHSPPPSSSASHGKFAVFVRAKRTCCTAALHAQAVIFQHTVLRNVLSLPTLHYTPKTAFAQAPCADSLDNLFNPRAGPELL